MPAAEGQAAQDKGVASASSQGAGGYVPALDGLRAVAIAGVYALHIDRGHAPGGAFGVDVFFVLSAYLITGNLLREQSSRGAVVFSAFYWRRVFRLMPALVVWLVLFAIPSAFASHEGHKVVWSSLGALAYINDFLQAWTHLVAGPFDQTWSLAVEEQFYLVWPWLLVFVILRFNRRHRDATFVMLVVVAGLLSIVTSNYFLPTGHLIALTFGCWAANQARHGFPHWILAVCRNSVLPIVGLLFYVAVALHAFSGVEGRLVAVLVDLVATYLIVCIAIDGRSRFSTIMGSAVPRWIGVRSYGIYLYGLTLLGLIPAVTHLRLTYAAPLDIVAGVVVVWASYRFVESPIRGRGRQWLRSRQAVVPAP